MKIEVKETQREIITRTRLSREKIKKKIKRGKNTTTVTENRNDKLV